LVALHFDQLEKGLIWAIPGQEVRMSALETPAHLISVLVRLRKALDEATLPFEAADAAAASAERCAIIRQLDDYLVPRLVQIDAPLLTVVGGSTGAGKSTLVNSLVGSTVSQPGVLRPTTRSPVLVHNVADARWFGTDRLLPDLVRTDHATHDQGTLQLVATDRLPSGVAILDAPDVDSIEERNRTLAAQLLAAADLWLFVTSAARYADQVPWDFLKSAAERSTAVAVVLDRTTPQAVTEVKGHLTRMLDARGLGGSRLFTVPESVVDEDGLLPADAVAPIREWLDGLAADTTARSAVVRQTLDGALAVLGHRARTVSRALLTQEQIAAQLRGDVVKSYADSLEALDRATGDGTLLRGEVLARWQEFVGAGEFMRSLEDKVGRVRDRLVSAARGRTQPVQRLSVAVESGLETLIVEHAESAAERAALAWRSLPAGAQLLAVAPGDIARASRGFRSRAEQSVRDWQDGVLALVRTEGSERRATARFLAYGVNSLGVVLMVAVFSQTAGLTGAEVGVAGGTAVLGQRILEAVFGDQAVRRLVEEARRDLHRRVEQDLFAPERQRFFDVLDPDVVSEGTAQRILELSREVEDIRWEAAPA
jgi:energy-coupling factor transporter ATP-binding protein EcfA2